MIFEKRRLLQTSEQTRISNFDLRPHQFSINTNDCSTNISVHLHYFTF